MPDVFRTNDLVRLVIGGPIMTVMNPQGAFGEIWCSWDEGGHLRREAFAAPSLMHVTPPKAATGSG